LACSDKKQLIDLSSENISRNCRLLHLSRSSYYYKAKPFVAETDLINRIADIHGQWPYYGYRKILSVLRDDDGMCINHKHVRRLMGEMGIRAIYPGPSTSVPNPEHHVYPYLLGDIVINRPDCVWAIDITYLKLPVGMVYLFALIDWYSRYIVGWSLATTMETCHALTALDQGLLLGQPDIANMDQGSQFTGSVWRNRLESQGIRLSHTGVGRCIDNVRIERFWRSFKYEDYHLNCYETVPDARAGISRYIKHYNEVRPHQALRYAKPCQLYFGETTPQKLTTGGIIV
jgi:putative transposase